MRIQSTLSSSLGSERNHRAVTLLLTMLALVLAVTVLSRQMMEGTVVRMASASESFATESRWIAEGVARQWQERSRDPKSDVDDLLRPVSWDVGNSTREVAVHVDIAPTSTENKIAIGVLEEADWVAFWRRQGSAVTLADTAGRKLLESGDTALEVVLGPRHITAQDAYVPPNGSGASPQVIPFDVMSVWGNGHVDLNRASRDVLQGRFPTFTDAQITGILRVRATGPMKDLERLRDELSLSPDQNQLLQGAGAFSPKSLELLIHVRRGGVSALYLAVLTLGKDGQILEVRPIL